MNIREIEQRLGIDEAKILYYQNEGLLRKSLGEVEDNEFSQEDLDILFKIKLLDQIKISRGEIKSLIQGEISLTELLIQYMKKLKNERSVDASLIEVVAEMSENETSFTSLDARKYLDLLASRTTKYDMDEKKLENKIHHPWRRYFARTLDYSLYTLILNIIGALIFRLNILDQSLLNLVVDTYVALALMLLVEPYLLSTFGTTFGKAVFGINLKTQNGNNLSYREGFERTFKVVKLGMGFQIPIYNLIRLYKSYRLSESGQTMAWDEGLSYTLKDTKTYRTALFLGANIIIIGFIVLLFLFQRIPPNRGQLTLAEFVENYHHYEDFLNIEDGEYRLDKNGEWVKPDTYKIKDEFVPSLYVEKPVFNYEFEGDYIKGISFGMSAQGKDSFTTYNDKMFLTYLALLGAQDDMTLFSPSLNDILGTFYGFIETGFEFEEHGLSVVADIESEGYIGFDNTLFSDDDFLDHNYKLDFSVIKKIIIKESNFILFCSKRNEISLSIRK